MDDNTQETNPGNVLPSSILPSAKLKAPKTPRVALSAIFMIGAMVLLLGIAVAVLGVGVAKTRQSVKQQAATPAVISDVSQKVQVVRWGMSPYEVTRIMGAPHWVILPQDTGVLSLSSETFGMELRWSNPECRDVAISFSRDPYRVIGIDPGNTYCASSSDVDMSAYDCKQPERQKYCRF